jgi:hypothetical protein
MGEQIVVGTYYKKWGTSYSTYVLLKDSNVIFLYSHLVRATKFPMILKDYYIQENDLVCELPNDAIVVSRSRLVALEDN